MIARATGLIVTRAPRKILRRPHPEPSKSRELRRPYPACTPRRHTTLRTPQRDPAVREIVASGPHRHARRVPTPRSSRARSRLVPAPRPCSRPPPEGVAPVTRATGAGRRRSRERLRPTAPANRRASARRCPPIARGLGPTRAPTECRRPRPAREAGARAERGRERMRGRDSS